jgi:GNAT superfamily N-acetyltransferase
MRGPDPVINRIDTTNDTALRAWYDAMREAALADRAEAAVMGYADLRGMVNTPRDDRRYRVYAETEGARVVGTLLMELPDRENQHVAELDVSVVPDRRRRGYGSGLHAFAERVMAEEGRSTALSEVYVPQGWTVRTWPGARFALAHGFEAVHEEDYLVLDLPMSPERLAAIPAHTGAYELLTWTGTCPEELVESYARMRTAMEEDVPTGELDTEPEVWDAARVRAEEKRRESQEYGTVVSVARAPSGELAGYSMVLVPREGEGEVYQQDTLVMRAHRGARLGSALKLRNLEVLARDFPASTQVRTWTDPDNTPMREVNLRFGFRQVERMVEFQRAR